MITSLLARALISGATSSLATALVASLMARRSGRSAAEPVNAVGSHLAGAQAMWRRDFSLESTLPGIAINLGGCLFWAGVMERWVHRRPLRGTADALGRGGIAAALAYTVDYHVLPRRLRPGYERKLSRAQLLAVYSVLSVTFPLRAWLSSGARRGTRREESSRTGACCGHSNQLTLPAARNDQTRREQT